MVRVWRPGGGERMAGVRGMAVHLSSGRQITFADPERLIAFLGEVTTGEDGSAPMQHASPDADQE